MDGALRLPSFPVPRRSLIAGAAACHNPSFSGNRVSDALRVAFGPHERAGGQTRRQVFVQVVGATGLVLALAVSIGLSGGSAAALAASGPFGSDLQAEYGMAVDGSDGLVVVNRSGVFRTVDRGARWTNITPRLLRRVADHVEKVIAIGPDIWLEMEGSDLFGFLPYSQDGGRSWRTARIAWSVQISNVVFDNPRDGWLTDTTSENKHVQYRTTDGGVRWKRSGPRPQITVPYSVSGVYLSTHGTAPRGLKIQDALRAPGGPSWALAAGPVLGSYYPTYLLRSTNNGQTWTTVPHG